ncbi:hypothetical protein CVT25_014367 [Psilocybe cyanescens]|uniref:Uncharacterized protein n=1 Tax=Psilocybe cyanescens TaxID=93625 RepID=A0A409XPK1_PSICY|nr:hypothetical protein CVT25_014367 [Psilocybe cyanescens]
MYYTNHRFRDFVKKRAFVDAELHPMRRFLFNTDKASNAYSWAIRMLPSFLAKSGYSDELIAYARQTRIRRNNDYLNFIYFGLERDWSLAKLRLKHILGG